MKKTEEKMNCASCFSPNEKFCSGCGRSNITVEEAIDIDEACEKELKGNVTAISENLQVLDTNVLLFIEEHKDIINVQGLIRDEIASRGLNSSGKWIGFNFAREYWNGVESKLLNEITPADEGIAAAKADTIDEFIRVKSDVLLELDELWKISVSSDKEKIYSAISRIHKGQCDIEISEFPQTSMTITEFVDNLQIN